MNEITVEQLVALREQAESNIGNEVRKALEDLQSHGVSVNEIYVMLDLINPVGGRQRSVLTGVRITVRL